MDENLFQGNKREREGGLGSTICLIIFRSGFLFCYFYCAKKSIKGGSKRACKALGAKSASHVGR